MQRGRYEANLAEGIYGTILATALVAGLSEDPVLSPGEAAVTLLVTCAVFWLAHTYSEMLARPDRGLTLTELRRTAAQEGALLESAILPVAALSAGWEGFLPRQVAFNTAIGVGVASLFAVGILLARREGYGAGGTVIAGLLSAVCGLLIVVLKVLVEHRIA